MSRATNDILISAFLALLLVWVLWEAREWPFRTRLFPWVIGFPVLALALLQFGLALWDAIRLRLKAESEAAHGEPGETGQTGVAVDPKPARRRTVSIATWTVVFALGFWLFGFKVGSFLLSPAFLRFQGNESWKMSIVYGLGIYLFFLVGFEIALGVPLPAGVIATSLGLQSLDWYLVNPILGLILRR